MVIRIINPTKPVFILLIKSLIDFAELRMVLVSVSLLPKYPPAIRIPITENKKKIVKNIYTAGRLNQSFNSKRKISLNIL